MLKRTKYAALMLIAMVLLMTTLEARASLFGSQSYSHVPTTVAPTMVVGTTAEQDSLNLKVPLSAMERDLFDAAETQPYAVRIAQRNGRRGGYRRNPYPANRPGRYRELPPPVTRAPGIRRYRFRDRPPVRRYRSVRPNRPGQFRNSISPSRAINLARRRVDGKLLGIRRAKRYGMNVYVIKFKTASRVREVIVDASSGSILN